MIQYLGPPSPKRKAKMDLPVNAFAYALPAMVALASPAGFAMQTPEPVPEYRLKAQLIRKLLDYLEWPVSVPGRPLVVAILEPSFFDEQLSKDLDGQMIKGRPVKLRFLRNLSQISQCDILFIPDDPVIELGTILTALKGKPILTIADTPGFASRGVIVNLVVVNGKVGLEINVAMLKASGVSLSPQVLKLSTIVR